MRLEGKGMTVQSFATVLFALACSCNAQLTFPIKFSTPTSFAYLPSVDTKDDCTGQCCIINEAYSAPVICSAKLDLDGLVLYSAPDLNSTIEPCISLDISYLFEADVELLYEASSFLVEKRQKLAQAANIDGTMEADFCKLRPKFRSLLFDTTEQCDSTRPAAPGSAVSVDQLLTSVNTCLDTLLDNMFPATDEPPANDYAAPAECPPTPEGVVGYDVEAWCQVLQGNGFCCTCRCFCTKSSCRFCPKSRCCRQMRPKLKKPQVINACRRSG